MSIIKPAIDFSNKYFHHVSLAKRDVIWYNEEVEHSMKRI